MKKSSFKKLLLFILLASVVWMLQARPSQPTAANIITNKGYLIVGNNIQFIYPAAKPVGRVYVVGNFMGWKKQHPTWEMHYNNRQKAYLLMVPIHQVKQLSRSFYEFTFLVNNRYIDASKEAPNVIHCAGYGYRYVIREL